MDKEKLLRKFKDDRENKVKISESKLKLINEIIDDNWLYHECYNHFTFQNYNDPIRKLTTYYKQNKNKRYELISDTENDYCFYFFTPSEEIL